VLVHPPTKSLLLKIDDPFLIRELVPQSRILGTGQYNLAVKLTDTSAQILRNVGIECPSPISAFYDWPGKFKPFPHQIAMAEFMTMHHKCFNLSDMGSMKTAASLWAADYLMKSGAVSRALIISPLSSLERTWLSDLFATLMHRTGIVVHGTREKRRNALATPADFYIINHDGIAIKEIWQTIHRDPQINLVIVDEGSKFKNADTDKWRAVDKMLRPDMRLWWLTGTPCANSPTDVWAQCKLVSPGRVPKFFGGFRRATMYEESRNGSKGFSKWIPRDDAYTIAYDAMQPAIRFRKKDCIDLPPVVTESWQARSTPEQLAAFKSMRNDMIAEAAKHQITAVNAADKLSKLRQILCGAVKVGEGSYKEIPHQYRTNLLIDAIESAAAKVIVIIPFKGITYALEKELAPKYSCAILNGDVSIGRRNRIITDFKTRKDPHVLLCHPQVMAHSLNLVEADVLVFYGPIYSNDEYLQVIERFNRMGQKHKMTIIRIGACSLEWEIYKVLDTRGTSQENVLKLYNSVVKGELG
jgi:SNF2 family DNA or RNA helicase